MIGIGFGELLLILLIALLVFKPKDLLKTCEALGRNYKHLKHAFNKITND